MIQSIVQCFVHFQIEIGTFPEYSPERWVGIRYILQNFAINTLRLRQNGCHFADKIFKCIFLNENVWISLKISSLFLRVQLTRWGRVTHICVGKLTIIVSDKGLSPVRRQAIIWNNDGILLIGPLGTNFSEILIEIHTFSFKKMHLKMSSGKYRPFCLGLNVLTIFQHWFR